MKKVTREEIAQQLRDCGTSLDNAYSGKFSYYIHIDEESGEIVDSIGPEVKTFECPAPYVDELSEKAKEENPGDDESEMQQFWDSVLDCEADLNSPFGEIVDILTDEINDYFSRNTR